MELCSGDTNKPLFNIFLKPGGEEEEEEEEETMDRSAPRYSILNESQIRQRQEDDIACVSAAISEPRAAAIVLLRRFNWNLSKLFDHWFEDEPRVRADLGLFAPPPPSDHHPTIACGICFEETTDHSSASCGHSFCNPCWSKYITESIDQSAAGCLLLTCPFPSCPAAVGEDMVESLASTHSDKEKFSKFLLRSYLEDSYLRHRVKWCPGPDCGLAVDFTEFSAGEARRSDVECRCSHSFCWNCGAEAHSPVGCGAAADWLSRAVDDSETAKWLAVHTKACPSCKRPIERSQGCDRMSCPPPCCHAFCWSCLEPLPRDCAHHECNKKPPEAGPTPTRESVAKYQHYYEQWVGCSKWRRKAAAELRERKGERLGWVGMNDFRGVVARAWDQMIGCRRVLQWSYAYGYYLPDGQVEKRQFLDYLLGQAESGLERLQDCAEKELEPFLTGEASAADFKAYCLKLSDLSFVMGNYFQNLVRALEDGLPEVARRHWPCNACFTVNLFGSRCYVCRASD